MNYVCNANANTNTRTCKCNQRPLIPGGVYTRNFGVHTVRLCTCIPGIHGDTYYMHSHSHSKLTLTPHCSLHHRHRKRTSRGFHPRQANFHGFCVAVHHCNVQTTQPLSVQHLNFPPVQNPKRQRFHMVFGARDVQSRSTILPRNVHVHPMGNAIQHCPNVVRTTRSNQLLQQHSSIDLIDKSSVFVFGTNVPFQFFHRCVL